MWNLYVSNAPSIRSPVVDRGWRSDKARPPGLEVEQYAIPGLHSAWNHTATSCLINTISVCQMANAWAVMICQLVESPYTYAHKDSFTVTRGDIFSWKCTKIYLMVRIHPQRKLTQCSPDSLFGIRGRWTPGKGLGLERRSTGNGGKCSEGKRRGGSIPALLLSQPCRPLVMVSALCSLQCCDADGSVAGRTSGP